VAAWNEAFALVWNREIKGQSLGLLVYSLLRYLYKSSTLQLNDEKIMADVPIELVDDTPLGMIFTGIAWEHIFLLYSDTFIPATTKVAKLLYW